MLSTSSDPGSGLRLPWPLNVVSLGAAWIWELLGLGRWQQGEWRPAAGSMGLFQGSEKRHQRFAEN